MNQITQLVQVGDRVPQAALRRDDAPLDLGTLVGRPFLMVFCGMGDPPAELLMFRDSYEQFSRLGVAIVGVSPHRAQCVAAMAERYGLPFRIVPDPERLSFRMFAPTALTNSQEPRGVAGEVAAVLVAPSTRVLRTYHRREPAVGLVNEVLADLQQLLFAEPARDVVQQAPVLLVPDVLPPALCRSLIELWESQGNEDSGFMTEVEGKTVGVYDYQNKIRRDHFLKPGPMEDAVKACLAARVLPEVQIAFNYIVTRREDFRIACYDAARGGYFRPHRDNTTAGTAHRRFALSLLLNDDYEGGYLRFPEYAPHHYRPRAGGAAVFSCSLLHEATDVCAGRRFVLISFFYGEPEARMREEYNRRTGGTYKA